MADFQRLDPDRIRLNFDLRGRTIVYVGSLEERKGVRYLIKAFPAIKASVPGVKLLIVGKPLPGQENYLNKLKNLAKDADIIFAGARPDVYDIMSAGDVLVAPSLSETFGRIIIEAMACGKPVVASNVGGIPEIIDDGRTGLLVEPKNEKSIADAVIRLLTLKTFADSIASVGRKIVEERFNVSSQITKIEEILDELLK
jgi:glycosyltransferase involved in cell wall biosynthesis